MTIGDCFALTLAAFVLGYGAALLVAFWRAPSPGSETLCNDCARVFCPHREPLHFHHDGCPSCEMHNSTL